MLGILKIGKNLFDTDTLAFDNTAFVSGMRIFATVCVDAVKDSIVEALSFLSGQCSTIITVGGLDKTSCGTTKTAVSQFCGQAFISSPKAKELISDVDNLGLSKEQYEFFTVFPSDSLIINNEIGSELGCIIVKDSLNIIMLPSQCNGMLSQVNSYLFNGKNSAYYTYLFKTFGIEQSDILSLLKDLNKYKSVNIETLQQTGEVAVAVRHLQKAAKSSVDYVLNAVQTRLQPFTYDYSDSTLEQTLVRLLKEQSKKISVAESLTGGLIASKIVSVTGASQHFYEGLVCYDTMAKSNRLNIKPDFFNINPVVSVETAYEMAAGLLDTSLCDIVIATTGYADNPTNSADVTKGLTYIAVGDINGIHVYKNIFNGDRNQVRELAAKTALYYAIDKLNKQFI